MLVLLPNSLSFGRSSMSSSSKISSSSSKERRLVDLSPPPLGLVSGFLGVLDVLFLLSVLAARAVLGLHLEVVLGMTCFLGVLFGVS